MSTGQGAVHLRREFRTGLLWPHDRGAIIAHLGNRSDVSQHDGVVRVGQVSGGPGRLGGRPAPGSGGVVGGGRGKTAGFGIEVGDRVGADGVHRLPQSSRQIDEMLRGERHLLPVRAKRDRCDNGVVHMLYRITERFGEFHCGDGL